MKTVNHLGTDPIGKLVPRIAFPSMLAQFVSVLYSIVDRMYIGHIASVGDLALAGVGVCGPILTMIGAFSSLIGVGGAPLLGIRLGEKNEKEASRILANAFLMLVSLSLVLTAAALFLTRPMLMAFGASTVTYPYARAYFMIYVSGSVFALLSTGLNQFVICQGFASEGMKSVLLRRRPESAAGPCVYLRSASRRAWRSNCNRALPDRKLSVCAAYSVRKDDSDPHHLSAGIHLRS